MALIALASATGAPGVSTTALGLALNWPRPVVLVEADPNGGSSLLAGYFRGVRGYAGGLIELALSAGSLRDGLADLVEPIEGTAVSFLAGTRSYAQATALPDLWAPLAAELIDLERTGQDAIVDCGRLGHLASPEPLLAAADLALLVTRSSLRALSGLRAWADGIHRGVLDWPCAGLLVVGEGQPYGARELVEVLGLPIIASLPDDPLAARVLSDGAEPPRNYDRGPLARGLNSAVAAIHTTVSRHRRDLLAGAAR